VPPPTATPSVSRGTRRKIKKVSPAGDWNSDPRLGGAIRRSARITSTQPPRRSSRLAALPQLNYRL
jgi:hypothetical protein